MTETLTIDVELAMTGEQIKMVQAVIEENKRLRAENENIKNQLIRVCTEIDYLLAAMLLDGEE